LCGEPGLLAAFEGKPLPSFLIAACFVCVCGDRLTAIAFRPRETRNDVAPQEEGLERGQVLKTGVPFGAPLRDTALQLGTVSAVLCLWLPPFLESLC